MSNTFARFAASERAGGVLLIAATLISLAVANSAFAESYAHLWEARLGALTLHQWINDALMAVFFLLIGLELQRELYSGELSDRQRALLPIIAAIGGMLVPAAIHFALNTKSGAQAGAGIPMATDIAFAMAVLALLGSRVPPALKVFVVAFAVIDDLGAIVVIAVFYSTGLNPWYLLAALSLWFVLRVIGRRFRVTALWPYVVGGVGLWWLVLQSGLHATLAGVALAFAVPHSQIDEDLASPAHLLENALQRPVALIVLPLFALANTALQVSGEWSDLLSNSNSLGILIGLAVGKPIGVALFSYAAVASKLCQLPLGASWRHMIGAGMLGGIGFTMSIFIANLAFLESAPTIRDSTLAVILASVLSGAAGYAWLRFVSAKYPPVP